MFVRIPTVSIVFALAVLGLSTSGCEEPPKQTPPATSAKPATTAPAPSAMPTTTASAKADADSGKMANCPNAVEGASTDIKDVEGGVELTITAKTEAATKDIRDRSKHLADVAKAEAASPRKHSGTGEGGGALGRCPVVMRGTELAVSDAEGGSKIVVKIKDATEVDWLRRESRERLAQISTPAGKDAGQGKMAHCPSAVDGATTNIKTTADAVVVTVTVKGDDKIKDVRERAKKIADASKADAATIKHAQDGSGGGGFGRCPVVLKDTTVTTKDVEGGSELTVTPKEKGMLKDLEKESQERTKTLSGATPGATATAAPK